MSLLSKLGFSSAIDRIESSEAHHEWRSGELLILDIREQDEWTKTGVPKGGHCISMSDKNFINLVDTLVAGDKTLRVAISCLSGVRSAAAGKTLRNAGLTNLKIVSGGFQRWIAKGLPVEPK